MSATQKQVTCRRLQLAIENAERERSAKWSELIRSGLEALRRWEEAPEGSLCEEVAALDYRAATEALALMQN